VAFDTTPVTVGPSRWALPDGSSWPIDDIVAIGADLEPSTLIDAYRHGLFPMHVGDDDVLAWWSPVLRGVIGLDSLRVSRSMRRSAKRYRCTIDESFDEVIAACAEVPRGGKWINEDMIAAYRTLHRLGWAHSVETWLDDELVGGLYGVRIDRFFAGESMFHTRTDASKVALMHLVDAMRRADMTLLDVQWVTPHLATLGATEIPRDAYLRRLASAIDPIA
jgi:leucyl/phenylalanyl-tRNA--protein transferase